MTSELIMFQVRDNYPVFIDVEDIGIYTFLAFPETIYVWFEDEKLTNHIRSIIDTVYDSLAGQIKWLFACMPQEEVEKIMQESIREYHGGREGSFTYETNEWLKKVQKSEELQNLIESQKPMPDWSQAVIDDHFWELM